MRVGLLPVAFVLRPVALTFGAGSSDGLGGKAFDCQEGLAHWKEEWSEGQQAWCCLYEGLGCSSGSSKETSDVHDCQLELDSWKTDWSQEKKDWCCLQQGHPCECSHDCAYNGTVTDCGEHFEHAAIAATDQAACESARGLVLKSCPVCQACVTTYWGLCSAGSAKMTTTAGQSSVDGAVSDDTHDCKAGLSEWMARWSYAKVAWCCQQKERPEGVDCPKTENDGAGESTTPERRFNCSENKKSQPKEWSREQVTWCCFHEGVACLDPGAPTPAPERYDCKDRVEIWEEEWDEGKKAWCCLYQSVGCSPRKAAYNCEEGIATWKYSWSNNKKDWCCHYHRLGCGVVSHAPTDDSGGSSNGTAGATFVVRFAKDLATSSTTSGKHSPATTTAGSSSSVAHHDCSIALRQWKAAWSEEKKAWCCEHESTGCSPNPEDAFDCQAGFAHWQENWEVEKQEWCCLTEQRGCLGPSVVSGFVSDTRRSTELFSLSRAVVATSGQRPVAAVAAMALVAGLMAVRALSRRDIHADLAAPASSQGLE